ncbi:hypothetical protein NECAME_14733 [Necator americanus]|uniref:Uncharacterized protein n=1 Tax=Necator americanus TaxID=51031 RepID=W2SLL7_NECAM|nr:hypothetical protein NECAME_14733 [Necator americanus]ETN70510.1 hypothetical protein NECAME_14733 [Necator americanus]
MEPPYFPHHDKVYAKFQVHLPCAHTEHVNRCLPLELDKTVPEKKSKRLTLREQQDSLDD